MTFENTLYEVNARMDEREFNKESHISSMVECEVLEETVKLIGVDDNSEGTTLLKYEKDGTVKEVMANKPAGYFDGLQDKIVYFSGLKSDVGKCNIAKWYIRSSMDVTDMEESLAKSDKFTEEEKIKYQRRIENFNPVIQRDLCDKKIILADKKMEESVEPDLTLYKEPAELDAYYETVKKVIPKEFRDVYEAARYRMEKNCSSSEKRNYLKQMADILDFDWVSNADYKVIDIEGLRKKIQETHIGHHKQLEEIFTEFEASNISKIAPKTLCLIGHPDTGINRLSETIASSIEREYSIINLAGAHMKEDI